ncbi:MAG: hypothetical protein FJ095_03520 [Deltaproteobacteria bacterium]|nr:hypothetical protein [Deltaproteobacteria bacterium]
MEKGTVIKKGVMFAAASAIIAAYGCERPNPHKLSGDTSAVFDDCPTPSTGSGNNVNPTSGTSTVASTTGVTTTTTGGNGPTPGVTTTGVTTSGGGSEGPKVEKTELDDRELDYSEALRTASMLVVGDLPTLAQIYELGDLPPEQQKAKYEELVDKLLADPRFADSMLDFFKYTFKMGGASTVSGEPTRETAPTFAARIVFEEKDWRSILTQQTNTCPTYNPTTKTFADGSCNNLPAGMMHSGMLTDPGTQSLFYGNLAFRRNRFFHETFLCRSGNEQAGGEPTDMPPQETPCAGKDKIPGYQNKWPVNEIAGACNNAGGVDFHDYNTGNICANCHATWNHRSPLFANFDSNGMWQPVNASGEYSVFVPVAGSPKAKLKDWLCVDPATCPPNVSTAWKKTMKVDGVEQAAPAANLTELGQAMAKDDEVIECTVKRVWNYAMGRADITEIGGRSWVNLPDRKDPNAELVTLSKLVANFKSNNYNLKKVLRAVLVSDDFTRF